MKPICPIRKWLVAPLLCIAALLSRAQGATAQQSSSAASTAEQKLEALTLVVAQSQQQLQTYQQQLAAMQQQLNELRQQLATAANTRSATTPVVAAAGPQQPTTSSLADLNERLGIVESQIATHEVSKVETQSKYPLRLSGLLLFNAFVNTRAVDIPTDPTYATSGAGSTGLSLRQTILGLDASGPHLFGASSRADLRVDFFGGANSANTYAPGGLLRLRTAHASLDWANTRLFAELDRTLVAPNVASSLVALSEPEFAWSGDLWAWNPQVGIAQTLARKRSSRLQLEAALIDVADPQLPNATARASTVSSAERSRWPGTEARLSFASGEPTTGLALGMGGYFSPHETSDGVRFNAWAGTLDARIPVNRHLQWIANAYRGLALGGLGAGGYVDYFYQYKGTEEITRPLDDVGGWSQLKYKPGDRLEFNAGFGIDNPFGGEINSVPVPTGYTGYTGLARNRSTFANVIYGPSNYLLFSLEYRRLWSNYATGPTHISDIVGLGAGYRF